MMFLGFVSGYLFGLKVLGWDPLSSVFCSLVVGISTIMIEMLLMICRIQKLEKLQSSERRRLKIE